MLMDLRFANLRKAVLPACAALLITGSAFAGQEVPLVDGTHWTQSSAEVKKAYLVGLANAIQIDVAYQGASAHAMSDFSPRVVKGMQGQTLDGALATLDRWYAANPDKLQRPVIETIWFEMVVPGLNKGK